MEIYVSVSCGREALCQLFLSSPGDSPTTHTQIMHLAMKSLSFWRHVPHLIYSSIHSYISSPTRGLKLSLITLKIVVNYFKQMVKETLVISINHSLNVINNRRMLSI